MLFSLPFYRFIPSTQSSLCAMPQVAAGDITGLYYIVVAGLPWQCTWQRLKDFARNGPDGAFIDIDHALVYPDSTDGWVRVKGKENFQRALGETQAAPTEVLN